MNQSILKEYTREVRVASYEVGAQRLLKLSVLMRMCQETSEQHVDLAGLSYEKMYEDGIVFFLITNQAKIKRMPVRNERITIKTHPRGVYGAQFYRDFIFYSGDEKIIEVMQTSVIADPVTHKVMRPKKFLDYGIFSGEKVAPEDRITKITVPDDLPLMGERRIYYSDLDNNRHLNNTIYGDILTDFLPGGAQGNRYARVQINYVNESAQGDVLRIYAAKENGQVLMRGVHDRGCCFTASATLVPKE